MNPSFIHKIDRWFGAGLCLLLTITRRINSTLFISKKKPHSIQKIIFLKWIEQGATVLAYDALEEAIVRVGKKNVYFCVFQSNQEILKILNIIPTENIISIRNDSFFNFVVDCTHSILRIRRLNIDASVDMEFFARGTTIFAYLSGARSRVGLHQFRAEGPYRGDLLTHRILWNPYLHITQAYRTLVEALFEEPSQEPLAKFPVITESRKLPEFKPTEKELSRVVELLKTQRKEIFTGPIVILNPNAGDLLPIRKWESARFIELGRKLLREHSKMTIILTGNASEQQSTQKIAIAIAPSRVLSIAGQVTLRELLTVYTLSDVMITNDSGPGHFASLTEIESIVIFGPETPKLFGSLSQHSHAIWVGFACSPCVSPLNHRRSPCNDNVCMKAVSVEMVYAKVNQLLEKSRLKKRPDLGVA